MEKYRNATIWDKIGNVLGEEGIKTDVKVKLPATTIIAGVVMIGLGVWGGIWLAGFIKEKFKK